MQGNTELSDFAEISVPSDACCISGSGVGSQSSLEELASGCE